MKDRNIIRIALLVIVVLCCAFYLRSATTATPEDDSCKESMIDCTKKDNKSGADKMIWENLSQQFFSSI